MPIDFTEITRSRETRRPVDPVELFQTLAVTDTSVNDLWLAQGDALRAWHANRSLTDVAVALNTGAGKTLVGLLAAQSLVNETGGHVLYVCSSIQLVQQTMAKAEGYGLNATTYFRQDLSNDLYQRGLAPCITTYHAVFNGKSRFYREGIIRLVFDDAHTAEHLIRDQYTLRVSRDTLSQSYAQVTALLRDYFARIGASVGYAETIEHQEEQRIWFVPPFAIREQLGELQRILVSARLGDILETMFAWEHVRDQVELCAIFVSGKDVSLTPIVLPVRSLPYFTPTVRRLYLSGTMPAKDAFLRTFARIPDCIIAPETTAGECERLILIPALHPECADDIQAAKAALRDQKALILVPSYRRAAQWSDLVAVGGEDVAEQVERFKEAAPPAKLILVARYDGLDLPGDTCRVMAIDDLPTGIGPLERFLWEQLGSVKGLRSIIASRVTQSFGRISRGMTDHGVVIISGKRLVDWLLTPVNQSMLPPFLRRQLELAIEVSKQAASTDDLAEALRQCLNRDPNWLRFYQDYMQEPLIAPAQPEDEGAIRLASLEVDFGHSLWARDYAAAARLLSETLDEVFEISRNAGAWLALWLGYCYELIGDVDSARQLYRRAHNATRNIPPYRLEVIETRERRPDQVLRVAEYLHDTPQVNRDALNRLDSVLAAMTEGASPAQVEEALRGLGEYLGLDSSRPEKEYGSGPDVLWAIKGELALSLEVKTGKTGQYYRKDELGQLRDHAQWVRDRSEATPIVSAFVGPVLPPSPDSNPSPDMLVIELPQFRTVAERLRAALEDICTRALPLTLPQTVHEVFRQRSLLWPQLLDGMEKYVLREVAPLAATDGNQGPIFVEG